MSDCTAGRRGLWGRIHGRSRRDIDASAFAFVMATGIVSVGAWLQHLRALSEGLLVVACIAWAALVLLACSSRQMPARPGLESFGFVAATAVLASRFSLAGRLRVALALWVLTLVAWIALLTLGTRRNRAEGGWFLAVVGTESLAVFASLLAPRWGSELLAAALGWWLLGLCLYPAVAAAIVAELRRCPRFAPALWIAMGALAIATLAGTELLLAARTLHALAAWRPLLRVGALTLWALASVWIMPLALADVRRRNLWALASVWIMPLALADVRRRNRWRNLSGRWSFVFPLGMYAVASGQLARAAPLPPLADVGRVFFALALLAWTLVLLAYAARVFQSEAGEI